MPLPAEQPPSSTSPSEVIAFLRFPLCALIVLYHAFKISVTLPADAFDYHQPVTDFLYWHILHDSIATSAVPLFFAISGYLYFHTPGFSASLWLEKTRKRFFRLIVPLLSWTFLGFLLLFAFHVLNLPNALAKTYFDTPHSFAWWLDSFVGFLNPMGPRLAPVAWFVRDLFVVGLLSPLLWLCLRRRIAAAILLALFFALYLFWFAPLPFLGSRALFFFSLGAACSIHQRDFLCDARRWALPFLLLWVLDVALRFHVRSGLLHSVSGHFLPVLFIPSILAAAGILSKRFRFPPWLAASSFFVYFCHESLWILIPWHYALTRIFIPVSDVSCLAVILVNAAGEIAICVTLYALLKRFFPWALVCLAGESLPRKPAH